MKNTLITLASLATLAVSANAQYLDDLDSVSPSGTDAASYTWTDATLGTVTATWSGTAIAPTRNIFANTVNDTDTGSFSIYAITSAALGGSDDTALTFSWDNKVSSFEFDLFDWDGLASSTDQITFAGVDSASILAVGNVISGFNYTEAGGNILQGAGVAGAPNLLNGAEGTGIRVGLSNADGSGFNTFTIDMTQGTDLFYVGGTASSVPEPSSTALLGLAALGLLARRKR